jgi:hypothetical protein
MLKNQVISVNPAGTKDRENGEVHMTRGGRKKKDLCNLRLANAELMRSHANFTSVETSS